jgi:pimeloyl-ACP methyl ester carboxylesterase
VALRNFIADRGYVAYPWQQGFNVGPRRGVMDACRAQLAQVAERHGCAVSLVGWSLGGLYARELAKGQPQQVRCVVSLASPFVGPPRATAAWQLYRLFTGYGLLPGLAPAAQLQQAPPVPTTSIFSKTDGVVPWQCSLNADGALSENIEVHASHLGMVVNPLALYAIADRLRQPPGQWQRFDVDGARRWFFKLAHRDPRAAQVA